MAANLELAQRTASGLLEKYRILTPPIDPTALSEAEGIEVYYASFSKYSKTVSGAFDFESNRIIVNREVPRDREAFTIAHELGHAMLHRDYAKSKNYTALPYGNWWSGDKPDEELEADAFAANLLVPLSIFSLYRDRTGISDLARMFGVSGDVILYQNRCA